MLSSVTGLLMLGIASPDIRDTNKRKKRQVINFIVEPGNEVVQPTSVPDPRQWITALDPNPTLEAFNVPKIQFSPEFYFLVM
jgi:hypothetical protein